MTLMENVAANVRAEIARQGHNATELALVLGITKQAVSGKMNAKTAFNFNEIEKISHWLGIEPQVLMAPLPERFAVA